MIAKVPPLRSVPAPRMDRTPAVEQKMNGGAESWFARMLDPDDQGSRHPLRHPMKQSVWVMRSIKKVTEPILTVPLEFKLMGQDGTETVLKDPALKSFWANPVKNLDYRQFIMALGGWNKLKGEWFIILDDTWFHVGMKKNPLILARPDAMQPIIAKSNGITAMKGELVGWRYTDASGNHHDLIPEYVIQHKEWNPDDEHRGLAEMDAARLSAEGDLLQGKFASNLARNNGDQGVFVVAQGNPPNEAQQKQIVAALREKRQAALRGENRPIFLSSDIKVEDPKIQTPDADFVAQRMENRHEVAIAFGVPPSMFDVTASYSIGSASDRYELIQGTCIPLSEKIAGTCAQITRLFLGMAPNAPLSASFNWDSHPVMIQVRLERLVAADKLWVKGVPMKTCNDYLKLGLPEYAGWEKGYLPFNVVPTDEPFDPKNDPAMAETPPKVSADPAKTLRNLFAIRTASVEETKAKSKREAMWKEHQAYRQGSVKNYRTKINKVLFAARSEVLAKIAAHYTPSKSVAETSVGKAGAAARFMFDLHTFAAEFKKETDSAARSAFDEAGQQVYDEQGIDDPWVSPPAKVKEFLAKRENRLSNVPQEVYDTINGEITDGVDKGESMKDLSNRVRSSFNEISNGRAKTIAITETGAAYGVARDDAMKSAGVEYKEWLTSHNANVRPTHAEADGQIREIDEPFEVGGEQLDFPCDPDGSSEEVINCHCVQIASTKDKALKCERERRAS